MKEEFFIQIIYKNVFKIYNRFIRKFKLKNVNLIN